jgi:hypothetical protein
MSDDVASLEMRVNAKKVFILFSFLFLFVTAKAQEASAALLEALTYVPNTETTVMFTDIALIKRYENAETVTSASPAETQAAFSRAALGSQAMLIEYNLQTPEHTDLWGWNAFDLRWIVTLSSSTPLSILAFREDFDLGKFTTLLEERNFSATPLEKATLYQHELELSADWFRANLQVVNTAVLETEKIIVMSASPEAITAVLGAHTSNTTYASVDSIQTIAERLGETATALLETNNCVAYGTDAVARQVLGPNVSQEKLEEIKERLGAGQAQVSPYQTLALAYRYKEDKPLGTLILNYSNTTAATNDLVARQRSAEEGVSFLTNLPYKESVFGLEAAEINGNNLIFKLHPVDNQPQRLFSMVYARDMAFAGC